MIVFENPGLIDVAAITTMGVSVKEEGAIGYFGTGLKFAIATILRNGGKITIHRGGEEELTFTAEEIIVRGEPFDRVCMNGEPIGFTTMLGRNWEPWMAFRELASNCRDEGGSYFKPGHAPPPCFSAKDGHTVIMVEGLDEVWPDRGTILLEGDPILSNEVMEVRDGVSLYVYYRGVRIFTAPRPLAFTYNLLEQVELTEDRTAKSWYHLETALERGIGMIDDRAVLRRMLTCGELFQEHHMDVPAYGSPQEAFREMARELAMGAATEKSANPAAVRSARASVICDMKPGDSVELDPVQARMLERAKEMLAAGGFKVDTFPIIVCDTLGPNICGLASEGRIFLSLMPFQKGTREVAATLLEEYAHLKSGERDCTRAFQNWLFDQLLSHAERASGEPF